jgi:putative NADPH-quinone reductase
MVEEVRTISTTEIPDWLKKYQDEILTRAQALGKDEGSSYRNTK